MYHGHYASVIPPAVGVPSIAFARLGGEIFLELSRLAVEGFGVCRRLFLGRDVGPFVGIFGVDLQPFVEARARCPA